MTLEEALVHLDKMGVRIWDNDTLPFLANAVKQNTPDAYDAAAKEVCQWCQLDMPFVEVPNGIPFDHIVGPMDEHDYYVGDPCNARPMHALKHVLTTP